MLLRRTLAGQGGGSALCHDAISRLGRMYAVGKKSGLAGQCGVHVDEIDIFRSGQLIDQRNLDLQVSLIYSVIARSDYGNWAAKKDVRFAGEIFEDFHQLLVISVKVTVMRPIHWLGVVGSEHDYDDIRLEILCVVEGRFIPVGQIALFQQRPSAHAEIPHLPVVSKYRLQLVRIRLSGWHVEACRNAVAHARDADRRSVVGGIDRAGWIRHGGDAGDGEIDQRDEFRRDHFHKKQIYYRGSSK